MKNYTPPLNDIRFVLEAFDYTNKIQSLPEYGEFDLDVAMSILDQIGQFSVNELLPLNEPGDRVGVAFNAQDHSVTTPTGSKEAYARFIENGFTSLSAPVAYGGMGAPETLGIFSAEFTTACNKSLMMCPGLTNHLIHALQAYGSDEQKETYLPRLISGEWSGTMCLTEPQCGTDLGLITTKAIPHGDHYVLNGTKIWITFGEHDLTENIVHLVLARLPDAPAGIKGISAFIVPKINMDGSRNGVVCGGLEHKMGIHASPTCVINFEDAKGYLVGEPHKGMRSMFVMMNAARLYVGLEGHTLSEAAYQAALAFAKDRRQSRSLDPARQDPDATADNILVHPDVRRMLLNIKSTNEALRGLATYIAMHYDIAHHHEDAETRQTSDDIVALLTPVMKSYGSERGFWNISEAMQVTGGAGYTQDWPIEQHLRDARIALIYEGTNHIQALDLVGRKLPRDNGRLIRSFQSEVTALIRECSPIEAMAEFIAPLKAESKRLTEVTMALGMKAFQDPEEAGAVANSYLNLFAMTTLAFVWCKQVHYALTQDTLIARAKIKTARFFFQVVLPEADTYARQIAAGKASMMDFDVEMF